MLNITKISVFTLSILGLIACTPNTEPRLDNTLQIPKEIHTSQQTLMQTPSKTLTANMVKHPNNKNATPDEIAECQKQGGTISKQGLRQFDFCVVEFADKGKACTNGSDCQAGRCISNGNAMDKEAGSPIQGVCPSNNVPFGCYGTINKGNFGGFLCVD